PTLPASPRWRAARCVSSTARWTGFRATRTAACSSRPPPCRPPASTRSGRSTPMRGSWAMSPAMYDRLWQALLGTVHMVGVSALIALVAGIPIAVFLVVSAPGGFFEAPRLNRAVGAVVNGFRATPFIVLLVALLPLTRLVTGTTIGVWAAIVPLSISATPFFARIAEVSLREVDKGLI